MFHGCGCILHTYPPARNSVMRQAGAQPEGNSKKKRHCDVFTVNATDSADSPPTSCAVALYERADIQRSVFHPIATDLTLTRSQKRMWCSSGQLKTSRDPSSPPHLRGVNQFKPTKVQLSTTTSSPKVSGKSYPPAKVCDRAQLRWLVCSTWHLFTVLYEVLLTSGGFRYTIPCTLAFDR